VLAPEQGGSGQPLLLALLQTLTGSLYSLSLSLSLFKINYSFALFCFVFAVVKQWSEGVKFHLSSGKQCPWPAMEKEQIYENLHQLFSVVRNWQDCKDEKVSNAAFPAQNGSADIHVGSSVCAQWAESRG